MDIITSVNNETVKEIVKLHQKKYRMNRFILEGLKPLEEAILSGIEIEKVFINQNRKDYIEKFEYEKIPECYPAADIHYNEVTWGSWGGMNISEMKFCFDITVPYNNRYLLDLLFRVPLEKRISDQHHLDIKKQLNEKLYDMKIRVVNMQETKFRAFVLNVIFTINSILPF